MLVIPTAEFNFELLFIKPFNNAQGKRSTKDHENTQNIISNSDLQINIYVKS